MHVAKTTLGPPPVPLRTPLTLKMSSMRMSARRSFSIYARVYLARPLLLGGGAGISTTFTHSSPMADARSSIDRKAFCTSCWVGSPG